MVMIFLQNDIIAPKVYIVRTTKIYMERIKMQVSIWDKKKEKYIKLRNIKIIFQNASNDFFDFKFTNNISSKKYYTKDYQLNFIHA